MPKLLYKTFAGKLSWLNGVRKIALVSVLGLLILATVASMKSVSAQGGVPVPKCGEDLVRDKDGNCVRTDAGWEKYCQKTYGPYSHYDKSKKVCFPKEYCQGHYGPGYQYDPTQNKCIKTTSDNKQSTKDKQCKATYGPNSKYDVATNKCVTSTKTNCATPYISIQATRWHIAIIEVDGILYYQKTLTVTVSPGNHRVYIVGLNWDQEHVGEWGPRNGFVDYCKPWMITVR